MNTVYFTRIELYNLVWNFRLVHISKKYGISCMEIRKACNGMQVPLPGSTYWKRLRHIKKLELPENYRGADRIGIIKRNYEYQVWNRFSLVARAEKIEVINTDLKSKNFEDYKLSLGNELLVDLERWLRYDSIKKRYGYIDAKMLCINVATVSIVRALDFMETFIKIIEYRGYTFKSAQDRTGMVFMEKGTVQIDVDIREVYKRSPDRISENSFQYIGTGKLTFQIRFGAYKKEWQENNFSLNASLAVIVATMDMITDYEIQLRQKFA